MIEEILVYVRPFIEWLYDTVDVIVRATPDIGGFPLIFAVAGFAFMGGLFIFVMGGNHNGN